MITHRTIINNVTNENRTRRKHYKRGIIYTG